MYILCGLWALNYNFCKSFPYWNYSVENAEQKIKISHNKILYLHVCKVPVELLWYNQTLYRFDDYAVNFRFMIYTYIYLFDLYPAQSLRDDI